MIDFTPMPEFRHRQIALSKKPTNMIETFTESNKILSLKQASEMLEVTQKFIKDQHACGWGFPMIRKLLSDEGKVIESGYYSDELLAHKKGKYSSDRIGLSSRQKIINWQNGKDREIIKFTRKEMLILDSLDYYIPVMLKGHEKYTPLAGKFLLTGYHDAWDNLPGYSMDDFHSSNKDYDTWFTVFSDTIGIDWRFLYPNQAETGETIKVITPSGCIYWVHGVEGLTDHAQYHYVKTITDSYLRDTAPV